MGKATELGKKLYEEKLKAILEPQEHGKFVAIEPETGQYFLGVTALEAIKKGTPISPTKFYSWRGWVIRRPTKSAGRPRNSRNQRMKESL
jgi:hypothetical protein